jgi:hypothetical protein
MDVDGDGDGMRWEKESPAKKESAGSDVGGGKSSRSTSRSRQTAAKEEVCTVLVVPGSGPGCLRSKKHPWDPKLGNNWNCRCAQKSPTPVTAAGQVHSVCYWAIPWTGAVKLKPFTRAKEALKNSQDKKSDDTRQKRHRRNRHTPTSDVKSGHDFRKGGRISSNLIWWPPHARTSRQATAQADSGFKPCC